MPKYLDRNTTCNICGKQFSNVYTLHRHMNIHDPVKKYPCHVCGKMFAVSYYVRDHMAVHEKRYTCSYQSCNKKFKEQGLLLTHLRSHQTRGNHEELVEGSQQITLPERILLPFFHGSLESECSPD
jgi:uncharacterized Zn-finger protein